ncbi:MAG: hypothetical protein JWR27_643 [Aeromicrobium sp.]|nr:hypothetical protein [Aeromicrobium sp.]
MTAKQEHEHHRPGDDEPHDRQLERRELLRERLARVRGRRIDGETYADDGQTRDQRQALRLAVTIARRDGGVGCRTPPPGRTTRPRGALAATSCSRRAQMVSSMRLGKPIINPTAVEEFVTARFGLHTLWLGQTLWIPNHHEPWPLRRGMLERLDDTLVAAAGLPGTTGRDPESVLHSKGVRTVFGRPRRIGQSATSSKSSKSKPGDTMQLTSAS